MEIVMNQDHSTEILSVISSTIGTPERPPPRPTKKLEWDQSSMFISSLGESDAGGGHLTDTLSFEAEIRHGVCLVFVLWIAEI